MKSGRTRAMPSGRHLDETDAAIVKGMLFRGDRQHDIAAWFGVNGGRIAEVATGQTFHWVERMPLEDLPPPGPYLCARDALGAMRAIELAEIALVKARQLVGAVR